VRNAGVRIAVASSAKKDELGEYLDVACIANLVEVTTSSEDAEESKPAPDIFEVVLKKLKIEGAEAVAIGDTPYDAEAAGKAKIATIGVLCGARWLSPCKIRRRSSPLTPFARRAGFAPES
jgi:phosphoglycolate phosphatase-like HAD superfamily hydrolase